MAIQKSNKHLMMRFVILMTMTLWGLTFVNAQTDQRNFNKRQLPDPNKKAFNNHKTSFENVKILPPINGHIVVGDTLSWSDFNGEVEAKSKASAKTFWRVYYVSKEIPSKGDTVDVNLKVLTAIGNDSWVKQGHKSDKLLIHEQGHYNLAILCKFQFEEKIQKTVFLKNTYKQQLDSIFKATLENIRILELMYEEQTEYSENSRQQEFWDKKIYTMIAEVKGKNNHNYDDQLIETEIKKAIEYNRFDERVKRFKTQRLIIKDDSLSWNDFIGRVDEMSDHSARIYWNVGYFYDKKLVKGDTVLLNLEVWPEIDYKSWVKDDHKSDKLLTHEQGHYNLAVLGKLQFENIVKNTTFFRETYKLQFDSIFQATISNIKKLQLEYDEQTDHMVKARQQKLWNKKIWGMIAEEKKEQANLPNR